VDSKGGTVDSMLSENRDIHAAKRFFKKALSSPHNQSPRVITVDRNPAYPPPLEQLMNEKDLSKETIIRQTKYLNNFVEQDHRFIKKITNAMMGFKSFRTVEKTISGIEAFHMLRKEEVEISPVLSGVDWINKLFGLTASFLIFATQPKTFKWSKLHCRWQGKSPQATEKMKYTAANGALVQIFSHTTYSINYDNESTFRYCIL
jgi:hypothetical protein